jgi:hypothetical protein
MLAKILWATAVKQVHPRELPTPSDEVPVVFEVDSTADSRSASYFYWRYKGRLIFTASEIVSVWYAAHDSSIKNPQIY